MNKAEAEFAELATRAVAQHGGQVRFQSLIEKELLLYDILFALEQGGFLQQGLVFIGGTLLRLCYGNKRYSVDLDFCGGKDFSLAKFAGVKKCIERHFGRRYGLEAFVKEPKESGRLSLSGKVRVFPWRIAVDTRPSRPDIPRQRVKLEISSVSAYTTKPVSLLPHYAILPDGYSDFFTTAATMEEVMADKLIALPTTLPWVRYRDIWDIQWMTRKGVGVRPELVSRKVEDNQITDYREKLDELIDQVANLATSNEFQQEMFQLLDEDTYRRTVGSEKAQIYQSTFMKEFLEEFRCKL